MKDNIFDGKAFAGEILRELKKDIDNLNKKLFLAVVSFGDGQSSYIKKKKETAEFLGIGFKNYSFPENMGTKEFRIELNKIAKLQRNTAIVVQLPLPKQINPSVLNVIPQEKDPDLLSEKAMGAFFNKKINITPPTAGAIVSILEKANINIKGVNVAIFGYGKLVGRFLVRMLLDKRASVRIVTRPMSDEEIRSFLAGSDIVISAVGSPHFLNAKLIPPGITVVDSGFSTLDGKVMGDVQFGALAHSFKLVSSVPGGVGSVGVAMLFKNVVALSDKKIK